MKSSKILNKSEDCSGFNKILRIYKCKSETPDQRNRSKNWIQIEMYNVMNE